MRAATLAIVVGLFTTGAAAQGVQAHGSDQLRVALNYYDSEDPLASRQLFVGPKTNGAGFLRPPEIANRWQLATIGVSYFLTRQLGVSGELYYERFDAGFVAPVSVRVAGGTAIFRVVYLF
jgi:hypothetical protein